VIRGPPHVRQPPDWLVPLQPIAKAGGLDCGMSHPPHVKAAPGLACAVGRPRWLKSPSLTDTHAHWLGATPPHPWPLFEPPREINPPHTTRATTAREPSTRRRVCVYVCVWRGLSTATDWKESIITIIIIIIIIIIIMIMIVIIIITIIIITTITIIIIIIIGLTRGRTPAAAPAIATRTHA
jgi:hypothetical protein